VIDHTERDAHAPLGWGLVALLSLPLCRNGKGAVAFRARWTHPDPDKRQKKTTKKWSTTVQARLLTTTRTCVFAPQLPQSSAWIASSGTVHDVSGSRPADPGTLAMPSITPHSLSLFGQTAAGENIKRTHKNARHPAPPLPLPFPL
jgi:hypothetical protein